MIEAIHIDAVICVIINVAIIEDEIEVTFSSVQIEVWVTHIFDYLIACHCAVFSQIGGGAVAPFAYNWS